MNDEQIRQLLREVRLIRIGVLSVGVVYVFAALRILFKEIF